MDRAFIAFGATGDGARERLGSALASLDASDLRIVAAGTPVQGPYATARGHFDLDAPFVTNTVTEVRTSLAPDALLERLRAVEAEHGRVRDGRPDRALDLDLLAHGDRVAQGPVRLPHPRALGRAFVLEPWAEIAPHALVAGTGQPVLEHRARLHAARPDAFAVLARQEALPLPSHAGPPPRILEDAASLRAWRRATDEDLALVPTMGALHTGHASLLRRARATAPRVLATLFVNPLQFGEGEDLDRYPRTFEEDLALLATEGVDAVYVPAADDLYPPGFATFVTPEGPALPFEGALRPGHFRGVATVVMKLLQRTRPDVAVFGQKDAQQVAVLRRMVSDLDVGVRLDVGPTQRDPDGLAMSSRNRYLDAADRARALALPRALARLSDQACGDDADAGALTAEAARTLAAAGVEVEYVAVVDPDRMREASLALGIPRLAVAAVRVGSTRLIDNRWLVRPRRETAS